MRTLDFDDDNKKQAEKSNELDNIDAKLLWGKIDKKKITNIKLDSASRSIITQQNFNLAYFMMINENCYPKYWLCVGINELNFIIKEHGNVPYSNIIYQNNDKILKYRSMPLYFLEAENKQRGLYLLADINKEQVKICFFNLCGVPIDDYANGDSITREERERERGRADGYSSLGSIVDIWDSNPPTSSTYSEALATERERRINDQRRAELINNNTFSHYTSLQDDNNDDIPF